MFKLPDRPDRSLSLYISANDWDNTKKVSGCLYTGEIDLIDAWDAYALGYLEALRKLIKGVSKGEFPTDTFGYPIFYLFSHYLELRIKTIILTCNNILDQSTTLPKDHNLITLWNTCNELITKIEDVDIYAGRCDDIIKNNDTLTHFIKEIAQDEKSQSFRYPVDNDENLFLNDENIDFLNVPVLLSVVNWLSNILDNTCWKLLDRSVIYDSKKYSKPSLSLSLYKPDENWTVTHRYSGYNYNRQECSLSNPWDAYAYGYSEAVTILINAEKKGDFSANTFGLPIFFLFNHYIELRMKTIISNGINITCQNPDFEKLHNLNKLWDYCKDILRYLGGWNKISELNRELREDYNTTNKFISEINFNNQSQLFRYPTIDNDEVPSHKNNIKYLNFPVFYSWVDWFADVLEGIDTGICEYLSSKHEYEAEYVGEY